jgi:hypothetical protein
MLKGVFHRQPAREGAFSPNIASVSRFICVNGKLSIGGMNTVESANPAASQHLFDYQFVYVHFALVFLSASAFATSPNIHGSVKPKL